MNLLPGLRDLRAPLAAGYLWLTAGWLYFAPQLPASVDQADGVLKDIYSVIEASGPVAVAAGLSFAAYMIGILSTGLLTGPISFTVKRLLPKWIDTLTSIPVFVLAILGILWNRAVTIAEEYADWVEEKYDRLSRSSRIRARKLVVRTISTRILHDSQFRDIVLDRLWPTIPEQLKIEELRNRSEYTSFLDFVRRVREVFQSGSPPEKLAEFLNRWESLSLGSRLRYMNYVSVDSSESDRDTKLMKQLSARINDGHLPTIESIVYSTIDVRGHTRDVVSELQLVPERLVGEKPATYERWDRLNAEGEFREAVVPPLVAIIIVLFSRGVLTWPSGLLLLIPTIAILIQGMIRSAEANGQLIQTLEAGVIPSTSLERLATMDLYWVRAAVHHGQDSQVSKQAVSEGEASIARQEKAEDGLAGTTKPDGQHEREGKVRSLREPAD